MTQSDNNTALPQDELSVKIHRRTVIVLQLIMAVELVLTLYHQHWINAFLIAIVMFLSVSLAVVGRRFGVNIPAEFQLLAMLFVFATLFLGEIRDYYQRIWWWDIALHTGSGLLLGIVGFLLVYVLNESRRIDIYLRPRFVALFAFMFAVTVGVLWEIFEFTMDGLFGANMQKPMRGDPSGLTDTMWDLIVDTLGALAISLLGWRYMERKQGSFIEHWIRKFIERNPGLFRRE